MAGAGRMGDGIYPDRTLTDTRNAQRRWRTQIQDELLNVRSPKRNVGQGMQNAERQSTSVLHPICVLGSKFRI